MIKRTNSGKEDKNMNDDPNILYCITWASRVYFCPMISENCVSINSWDGVDSN